MTNLRFKLPSLAAIAATLSLAPTTGCDLDVPDLNNPGLADLQENPTRAGVSAASTGLLIGNRRNRASANGYTSLLGILGRESYSFDAADPRYIGEMLGGPLQPGSPFGGNFWGGPYANVRLANIIQRAVDRVADFSPAERAAIRGFSSTIEATDLLEVTVTRDTNGGVLDTDRELGDALGPIVGRDEMLAGIAQLLDAANTELMTAADIDFPFALSSGYDGFDTPATYRQVNRAFRARVAAYQKDYATVLTALADSFLNDMPDDVADLQVGVYHVYSTQSGDATNGLINPALWGHPSFETDAMMNGQDPDNRFTRKTRKTASPGSAGNLSSNLKYTVYPNNQAPVPIIRNEELILLRAEARWFTNDRVGATADLNTVRTVSGNLLPITQPATDADFITALLYERRYSLVFEGHRWIDVRRFDRISTLPLDLMGHVHNVRFPIPQAECDARPGEPACMRSSTGQ